MQAPGPVICLDEHSCMPAAGSKRRGALRPLSAGFVPTPMWQKLAPLALIFFCATFNHTLLVNMKARCP